MQYYRNHELAKLYHVSQSAVGKWVEAARKGRLNLTTIEFEGKSYIAATSKNRTTIEAMVKERKKYFNRKSFRVITPTPEFYNLLAPEQILDIINHLDVMGEIPLQYSYVGDGAVEWDKYVHERMNETVPRTATLLAEKQLEMNKSYIDNLLGKFSRVNVVDIGPGNAIPVKELLEHLIEVGKLGRYLGIDISAEMLEIARQNISKWFGDNVQFDADIRDITYERFGDALASNKDDQTTNLLLFLGSTLGNFRSPTETLNTLRHSMGRHDLLVCNFKLDTEKNRNIIDLVHTSVVPGSVHDLPLRLLSIDESLYSIETGYDPEKRWRFARVRLNVAISIRFSLPDGERHVDFKKDETILIWHYKHQTAREVIDQFEANGFNVIQASQTEDHEFLLVICDVKTDRT